MIRAQCKTLLLSVVVTFLLTAFPAISSSWQGIDPITKYELISALKKEALSANMLIREVQRFKVTFQLTVADEAEIRHAGSYLGKKGMDALVAAVRINYRGDGAATVKPTPPPSQPLTTLRETRTSTEAGSELTGISETGVRARVKAMGVHTFASPSQTIYLDIENQSTTGTITNIGFFIRPATRPSEGSKIDVPGEITRAGNYKFVATDLEIETSNFKVISAFAFLTRGGSSLSQSFHRGFVQSGIPPGQSTRFSIAGDNFLGDVTIRQLEKGVILRFQGIGKDDLNDIAIYTNANALFSSSDSTYQIYKRVPNK